MPLIAAMSVTGGLTSLFAGTALGTARALGDGNLLPRVSVHFRDGTITPQQREYGHYRRGNEYGEMVCEGIARSRTILDRIMSAPAPPPVFAGAVKTTQAKLFSTLLNWYIAHGSRGRLGEPTDPHWDTTRAAHIADNEAMSYIGHTGGDPPPTAPRYEFLESLRRMAPHEAAGRVDRNVRMIVA